MYVHSNVARQQRAFNDNGELLCCGGCGNRSVREKGTSFFRLPSVITHQREEEEGKKTHNLSKKRRFVASEDTLGGPWTREVFLYSRLFSALYNGWTQWFVWDEINHDKTIWRCSNEWMLDTDEESLPLSKESVAFHSSFRVVHLQL